MQRETHSKILIMANVVYGFWISLITPFIVLSIYLIDVLANVLIESGLKPLLSWLSSFASWVEPLIRGIKGVFDLASGFGYVMTCLLIPALGSVFFLTAHAIQRKKKWLLWVGGIAVILSLGSTAFFPLAPILSIYLAWYIITAKDLI